MAFPGLLPAGPIITTGGPHPGTVNDDAAKDKKVRASRLISDAGWHGRDAIIARGVMGAESGFRPDADNGICCIGLMQINMPVWAGKVGIPADHKVATDWLKDPVNNLKAAHAIQVHGGWTPWETYTNGSYKMHEKEDPLITVKHNTILSMTEDAVGTITDPLGAVGDLASALLSKDTWFRIGKGIVGWNLLLLGTAGLVLVVGLRASKTAPVKTAIKVAKKIPPV